jgi:hypothetical protein
LRPADRALHRVEADHGEAARRRLADPAAPVGREGRLLRTSPRGSADVSYGIIIRNHSPNADALNVRVLVNFVLANKHLLGSASNTISLIPAGSSYALGNNLGFPGAAPIARLEVVIQLAGTNRHVGRVAPARHAPGLQAHDRRLQGHSGRESRLSHGLGNSDLADGHRVVAATASFYLGSLLAGLPTRS